ncbi:MAG: DUF2520 domain-containing protein [Deltaproteobacteria bacterium]|nr:MAG: DUF2520 domain-containing protein [Deltaproteobacteria bacterium]
MKPSFAIVGCGKVGIALGKYLAQAGYKPAGVASRSLFSAKRAADITGTDHFDQIPWEITKKAEIIFLTTPDRVISRICASIAKHGGFIKDAVVLHCSGALPSTILSPAKKYGAFIGSMHPLQSFASSKNNGSPFKGIIISVEGEKRAVTTAGKIAADLGAECLHIKTEAKILYHAAAATASNYLVTLLYLSLKLIEAAGISENNGLRILKPLIDGTLSNIEKVGITKALTGPIDRGDIETIERHLSEIRTKAPELVSTYKSFGFHTIDIAIAKGTLSELSAQRLRKILEKQ